MPHPAHPVKEKARPYSYTHPEHDAVAVLIHGFTGSPYDMRELADFLYARGIDVEAVRIAGHGSHIEDLMHSNYDDWLASVEDAVEKVEQSGKRIFLIGYSFGANIALDLASRHPERCKGIVCLGTSIYWKSRWYYFVLYHLMRLMGVEKIRKPYVPKFKVEAFESTGNYADFPITGLTAFRDIAQNHTRHTLHKVTTPALIIHSRDDRISHPRSSEFVFENIRSQYKEMFMLPEFNHNPLRSENKNKIFERVAQFISS